MSIDFNKLREEREADKKRFYLILSGDKDFINDDYTIVSLNGHVVAVNNESLVHDFVTRLISKRVCQGDEIRIVTGDNKGVDKMAESYGTKNDYDVYIYEAHWEEYGNKAGFMRNEEMIFRTQLRANKACVLFWDGENKSTLNLIYLATNVGIKCKIYNYRRKNWLSQEEMEAIEIEERRNKMRYGMT